MTDDLTIETITDANFDDFLYLVGKLADYEKLSPPNDDEKVRLKQDGLGENPKYFAHLGRIANKYVAYVIYYFNYSSFVARPLMYIEDIYVLDEYRRQGIGTEMLEFCVQQANKQGCGRIEWCVLDWNEPALRFYAKNGAKKLNWTFFRLEEDQINSFNLPP